MQLVHPKRIKHLARYFCVLGAICIGGYSFGLAPIFLIFVAPPILLVYLLRTYAGVLVDWIPNNRFLYNLLLLFPITISYFGLIGFQLKNILNERGKIRFVIMLAFLFFLAYIHRLALQEISLYWAGSSSL